MLEVLNWKNSAWMEYFNERRNLWTPVAEEWERLSKEYLLAKR